MPELRILLLGPPRVSLDDGPALHFPTRKTLELVAFAALSRGEALSRSRVSAALRDEVDDAQSRRSLSTDLWRLRKLLADAGLNSEEFLFADRTSLGFRVDAPLYLDVVEFESIADRCIADAPLSQEGARELTAAMTIYRDDFLVEVDREWCLILRERLRGKYAACLDLLLSYCMESDEWGAALRIAQRMVQLDPLMEHGHRAIMQCQYLMGNRGAAIRQFNDCRALLQRELDVEPAEETLRMYRGLMTVQPQQASAAEPIVAGRSLADATPLTDQLSMAMGNLDTARKFIQNVDQRLREDESPR